MKNERVFMKDKEKEVEANRKRCELNEDNGGGWEVCLEEAFSFVFVWFQRMFSKNWTKGMLLFGFCLLVVLQLSKLEQSNLFSSGSL